MTETECRIAECLDAVPEDFPGEPKDGERLAVLERLSDMQLYKLLYLVQAEGSARGFGDWWWE